MKEVRKPKLSEAEAIIRLVRDTARRVNSADYSQKQIDLWLVKRPIEIIQDEIDQGVWWVCVDDEDVLGVGTLATAELRSLGCLCMPIISWRLTKSTVSYGLI